MTSAALRAEFEREEAERHKREQVTAEKEKQKEADTAQRAIRIADDALNRMFTGHIPSFWKDDLRALALAVSLSDKGTNAELQTRIQDFFDSHPDLKLNTRFSGLFQQGKRRNVAQVLEEYGGRDEENEDEYPSDHRDGSDQ